MTWLGGAQNWCGRGMIFRTFAPRCSNAILSSTVLRSPN